MMSKKKPILDQDDAYNHPRTYRVFVEDEFRFAYDPTAYPTLKEVIDDIRTHIASLRADGLKEWGFIPMAGMPNRRCATHQTRG